MINYSQPSTAKYTSISFVGVSMGGLVIRAYLHKYKIPNLGKVVLIGTPNKGSEVADYLKNNKLYKNLPVLLVNN
ncbi:hypothetical protein OTSGILL_0508 [Orientia tsutsugamushi str. Gilliam]|uniref:Uncharacterized protein n=1 Tax=Orientia tsutsugamushi str. Gilliam TaxID=1359184 RepID=A0A0F3MDE5_ORITS|nr:alpha/beta hydrolase [Orientia tsutsugamushi]KJV53803.1 hypothetical protein OTSGILL_0508 [Orientia tsutsugamushi str. Gilliam]